VEGSTEPPALAEWPSDKGGGVSLADEREGKYLLPLLLEESRLLADYGPEHPAVRSVRERINAVRRYLEQHPPPAPSGPGQKPPPAPRAPVAAPSPRGRETKIELFPVTVVLPGRPQRPEVGEGAEKRVEPGREVGGKVSRPADAVPTSPAPTGQGAAGGRGLGTGREQSAERRDRSPDAGGEKHPPSVGVPAAAPAGPGGDSIARYPSGIPRWLLLGAGLFFAGLLAHLAALRTFLRRYGRRLARRLRTELEAEGPGHSDGGAPNGVPPARAGAGSGPWATAGPAAAGARVCWTGEPSGTDSAGGEESPGRAPVEAGPDAALLRQVFEDNLLLREQLEQLHA
jgi:hypothetical protein